MRGAGVETARVKREAFENQSMRAPGRIM